MPDDVMGTPQMNVDVGAPLGSGTQAGVPGNNDNHQGGQPQHQQANGNEQQGNRNLVLPQSAMKRIKEEERAKGKTEALEALAQASGYESHADLVAALASLRSGQQNTQQQPQNHQQQQPQAAARFAAGQNGNQNQQPQQQDQQDDHSNDASTKNARREQARYERQLEKTLRERDAFAQRSALATQRVTELESQLDAKEAEMSLRETAVTLGVKDVDYALRLLTRELEGKSEDEMQQFDERAFFEGLRASKPYLFGEVIRPANTGTGTSGAPPPPRPGQQAQQSAANGHVDVNKMNPQEYQQHLRKRGLNPHM